MAVNVDASARERTYFDIASLTCERCPGTRLRSENGLYRLRSMRERLTSVSRSLSIKHPRKFLLASCLL